MEKVYVVSFPGYGPNCEENDGFGAEVFLVSQAEWKQVAKDMKQLSNDKNVKTFVGFDYTCGGHGCLIDFDIKEAYDQIEIIEKTPTVEVLKVIRKIESDHFWQELLTWIKGHKNKEILF